MKLRLGLFTGLILGYYLGAKAGRERYEQLNRLGRKVRKSNAVDAAADKAKAAAETGYDKAKSQVRDRIHHNGKNDSQSFSPS